MLGMSYVNKRTMERIKRTIEVATPIPELHQSISNYNRHLHTDEPYLHKVNKTDESYLHRWQTNVMQGMDRARR